METPKLIQDLGMLYATEKSKRKSRYGIFKCPYCNNSFKSQISNIKNNHTKSCGCFKKDRIGKYENLSKTRIYSIFNDIRKRTLNKKHSTYKFYGAKGITICKEWRNDFIVFYKWAMDNGYDDTLTIERKNVYGNYEPNNCEWIPMSEQHKNKRDIYSNNKTGYKGIQYRKDRNQYAVAFTNSKTRYFLGYFKNIENAIMSHNDFIIKNNIDRKLLKAKV